MEPILLTSHLPCFAPNESCRSWILFPGKCLLLCRNNFAKVWSCFAPFRSVYKTKTVVKQERLGVFIWRFLFFAFQFGCSEWRSIDHRNNWRNSEASHPNCSSGRESAVLLYMKLFTALLFDFVHRFHIEHNAPCSVPQILHNLCPRNDCNTQKKLKTIVMHFFLSGVGGCGGSARCIMVYVKMVNSKWKCKWSGLVITVTELNEGKWRGFVTIFLDIDIPKCDESNPKFAFIQWNLSLLRLKVNTQNDREKSSFFVCLFFFCSFTSVFLVVCLGSLFVSVFFHSSRDFQLLVRVI